MRSRGQCESTANNGVLSAVGNTPLVRLSRLLPEQHFELFGKLEYLNPAGSIKDRAALNIIRHALADGTVSSHTVIIESSSGNMGIGLAQVCAYFGLKFICVVDQKTTKANLDILSAYGAELDIITDPDPDTGELLPARLDRVRVLLARHQDSFWPNQYANRYNSTAHFEGTMPEILDMMHGSLDYLFCATSTCGTLSGCSEYVERRNLKTKIIAVDAIGSVIFAKTTAKRRIPGHGAALVPPLYKPGLAHQVVYVDDIDCVRGCRSLLQTEAILAGGSSGAVVSALRKIMHDIPPGSTCVLILADRGERYIDTIFNDEWVSTEFGEVALD